MLARINPPITSSTGAANLPTAPGKPAKKTGLLNPTSSSDADDRLVGMPTTNGSDAAEIKDSAGAEQSLSFLRSNMFSNSAGVLASHAASSADTVYSLLQG